MRLSAFRTVREKNTIAVICLVIVGLMSVAAFWPFDSHPANHVNWLSDENGLRFDGRGVVSSPKDFEFPEAWSGAGVSLELWLEPSQDKYSTALLSFSSAENPDQFRLRQSHDFLLIVEEPFATDRHTAAVRLWVAHAFQAHKRRFIAICSGTKGTTVYLDGIPAENSPAFKISSKALSGQLIVGASPTAYDTWRGKFLGLAIFGRELTPAQVSEHYQAWLNGRADAVKNDQPAGLYAFAERPESVARNQVASGPDLRIPANYSIPYKPFLKSTWREFYPNRTYLLDIVINVAGFVPLGFFFCMLFSSCESSRKAVTATIVLGAVFSLTIEVLQWFIPMRDSGTTDLITNTLGTALGAMLYKGGTLEILLRWLESRASGNVGPEQR